VAVDDMRSRIVAAATEVMRTEGVRRATTRRIAATAGVAEGSIYNHFADKADLVIAVVMEGLPLPGALGELAGRVGTGTVRDNLVRVVTYGLEFYGDLQRLTAMVASDPDLYGRLLGQLDARGIGPRRAQEALTGYLAAERAARRLTGTADLGTLALLLTGACQAQTLLEQFHPELAPRAGDRAALAGRIVDTVLPLLAP
jgi:AcrR family transcriptional regulator